MSKTDGAIFVSARKKNCYSALRGMHKLLQSIH